MKNRTVLIAIIILVSAIAILSYINLKGMSLSSSESDKGIIFVSVGNREEKLDMETITALTAYEFEAVQDTSTGGPERHKFKGILLKDLILKVNSEASESDIKKVVIKGADGYSVALGIDEVLAGAGVYLTYEKDGKPLGTKRKGGNGPYQLIVKQDSFSMRWCKFVSEVIAE